MVGARQGPVGRSRLLEEGQARPYVPHPELGTGPGRVGLSGRRPTAQETSVLAWKLIKKAGLRTPLQTPRIRNSVIQLFVD